MLNTPEEEIFIWDNIPNFFADLTSGVSRKSARRARWPR